MPTAGSLFPYLKTVRCGDRATEFNQRCQQLGITGVTLHSYRYVWAERAKRRGYPERFAQEALGHNSKAVHRAYARKAKVKLPSLESYEKHVEEGQIIQLPPLTSESARTARMGRTVVSAVSRRLVATVNPYKHMSTRTPECWVSDPNARAVRVELSLPRSRGQV